MNNFLDNYYSTNKVIEKLIKNLLSNLKMPLARDK